MYSHILKYHVGIPLVAFVALIVIGVPAAAAFGYALAAGCVSMVVMMIGGGHRHHGQHEEHRSRGDRALTSRR